MDFLIVLTESHRSIYEQFFLKSLPNKAVLLKQELSDLGAGDHLSQGWQEGVTAKLRHALEHAEGKLGSIFVLSDVDLQFFPGFKIEVLQEEFERSKVDILFQREGMKAATNQVVNTGFYVASSTPYVRTLLADAIRLCESSATRNDQTAINALLKREDLGQRWNFLSNRYYARSHGFPPPRDLYLHHANASYTIAEKARQLAQIRRYASGNFATRGIVFAQEAIDYAVSGRLRQALQAQRHH